MPDPAPEADVVKRRTDPLFALQAEVGLWEGDGSSPVDLDVLRDGIAEIERLRAEVAELRYQLNRETNPRRNQ